MPNLDRASIAERLKAGRALRKKVPRKDHASWTAPANRPDPIKLLIESDTGRIPSLLPIRYGRMRQSPFAFLRGAAALMAFDLAQTPTTRLRVQVCGDCYIMNFGSFSTPERNLIFDINDFDETLPAQWEWDLKRLIVSIEVAGRAAGTKTRHREHAVRAAVRSYREHLGEFATMPSLDAWYQQIDFQQLLDKVPGPENRKRDQRTVEKARRDTVPTSLLPSVAAASTKIKDHRPLIYHLPSQRTAAYRRQAASAFRRYRDSLAISSRVLFDRFELLDVALKVVGIGSVGTFCEVALFGDAQAAPLFLQIKEARASVLEPYAARSVSDPRTAGGLWPTPDAGRQRHIPGLDGRSAARPPFLRAPIARYEDCDAGRSERSRRPRVFRRCVRLGGCLGARALGRSGDDRRLPRHQRRIRRRNCEIRESVRRSNRA